MPVRIAIVMLVANVCCWKSDLPTVHAADEQNNAQSEIPTGKDLASSQAGSSISSLTEGWTKDVDLPAVESNKGTRRGAILKMWVEQGWIVVRRETPDGYWEWQIVLAHASDPNPPQVRLGQLGSFEINYEPYFIREALGRLRVFRERKTEQIQWPAIPLNIGAKKVGFGTVNNNHGFTTGNWVIGDWIYWSAGLSNDRNDVWMRIQHKAFGTPFVGRGSWPMMIDSFGDCTVQDEGDLLIAQRQLADEEEVKEILREKQIRAELKGKQAPELDVKQWFNGPEEKSLEKLRGKVVLLYFWDTSSPTTSSAVPNATALHKQFGDRGLVTIGVHPLKASDKLEQFLKSCNVESPIAVDTGETAKNYAIDGWPTYFLIDKEGKVRTAYSSHPPTEKQIEDLLK